MKIHPAVQPLTCFFSEKQGLKPIYSLTTASPSFLKKFQSTETATANCATHLLLAIFKKIAKSTKLLSLLVGSRIRQMELLLQRYRIALRNCWNIGWPCHSIHGLLPYFQGILSVSHHCSHITHGLLVAGETGSTTKNVRQIVLPSDHHFLWNETRKKMRLTDGGNGMSYLDWFEAVALQDFEQESSVP